MKPAPAIPHDDLLFGFTPDPRMVAVELEERRGGDEMALFFREGDRTVRLSEPFRPFLVAAADALAGLPSGPEVVELQGPAPLNRMLIFRTWKECARAKAWLADKTDRPATATDAPYLWLPDPVHQHLVSTGRAHFLELPFGDLRRMQVDIECRTSPGYEFCNAEREGDAILAIGLGDQTGWTEILSGPALTEKQMLERFAAVVQERDPDVLEGHNIFNFDLPYLFARARRHGVELRLGRDGSVPASRPSRFSVGERTISYERFEVFGRHVVDTLFLVNAYDVTHRSLAGFGLKEVAQHFGLAAPDRTYIEGSAISATHVADPAKLERYLRDDVAETRAVAELLSQSAFVQARLLPFSYQSVCVRGTAAKVDALMLREYVRRRRALPMPGEAREFAGGYTDIFVEGVVRNVHHCDVRSLYPSLMLAGNLAPRTDELKVFLTLLRRLRDFRLQAKARMQEAQSASERNHLDALQTTFKVLINSFYGYLGFGQARFGDFSVAEEVTRRGRELLSGMIDWLRQNGATPVEIDTDGIYYVPPAFRGPREAEEFRTRLAASLPQGIEVEFDGEYVSMYSYKMKNYALLSKDGEIVVKGAALKSRGLEPFQREFLREVVRLKLEGRDGEIAALRARFERAIRSREWPVARLAKTERLQDSPASYQAKRIRGQCPKDAAYELALAAERPYRAGDQVSFYVTGEKKSVAVHGNAKLVASWDPAARDENVEYYVAKLNALHEKFAAAPAPAAGQEQAQMDLGFG